MSDKARITQIRLKPVENGCQLTLCCTYMSQEAVKEYGMEVYKEWDYNLPAEVFDSVVKHLGVEVDDEGKEEKPKTTLDYEKFK